jgi:hypothetical protein
MTTLPVNGVAPDKSSTAPVPAAGLGSNSNYILASNCNPILDLSVTIDVTEDIVCKSSSGSTKGFGFQLNAYSPPDETSAWQQYVIALFGSELTGAVDNWPITGNNIINDFFNITSVPKSQVLPAGYQLQIALRNEGYWRMTWQLAPTGGWAGPADSGLLLYDRSAGVGAFYAVDARGDLDLLQQYNDWRTSWDLAVTGGWAGPGNSGLLLYDRSAGVGAFYGIDGKGNMKLLQQYNDWRTSWDLAVSGGWAGPGNSGLLLYDRSAGFGAFYAIDGKGNMKLLQQDPDWRASWDLAVTGGWAGPGNSGLLLYDRSAGLGVFYAITAGGNMNLLQQDPDWRASWDLAVCGGWAGPADGGLLLYDRSAGLGAFYGITHGGNMNLLQQSDGSVRAADYVVVDPTGKTVAHVTKYLESLSSVSGGPVRGSDLAPIVAFELNLVGPENSESTILSSGAGNIVYTSSTPLTALAQEPSCTESGYITAETANSVYGLLPLPSSNTFTQSFTVSSDGTMIRKKGKARPGFIVRPTAGSG